MAKKPLVLIGKSVSPRIRAAFAKSAQLIHVPSSQSAFPSGEPFVEPFFGRTEDYERNKDLLKGASVIVVQSTTAPRTSQNLQDLFMTLHTLKTYDVAKITVVMPFAPLLRQDRKFPGRFVSQGADYLAKNLKDNGADAVVTMTPHSPANVVTFQKYFGDNFKAVSATDLIIADLRAHEGTSLAESCGGGPDAGSIAAAQEISASLGVKSYKISKEHTGMSVTKITRFEGDVKDRQAFVFDDMVDGMGTASNAATTLHENGAKSVVVYAPHGILTTSYKMKGMQVEGALEKAFNTAAKPGRFAVKGVVITDSVSGSEQKARRFLARHPELPKDCIRVVTVGGILHDAALETAERLADKPAGARPQPQGLAVGQ